MSLQNSRVLVIGGTSGIGLAVAQLAAERGAVPIVASRRQASVDRALETLPAGAVGLTVDLLDDAALASAAERIGDVDHVVFTAGDPLQFTRLSELSGDRVAAFFGTRFVGALNAVRTFAPHVSAGGSITLTSGTAAHTPGFGVLPVSVCGAMNAATTALAFELAPIRVNAVAPGVVRTPLWDALDADARDEMFARAERELPLRRVGDVTDAALAYVYCMEQTFGTGTVIVVDGGTLLV